VRPATPKPRQAGREAPTTHHRPPQTGKQPAKQQDEQDTQTPPPTKPTAQDKQSSRRGQARGRPPRRAATRPAEQRPAQAAEGGTRGGRKNKKRRKRGQRARAGSGPKAPGTHVHTHRLSLSARPDHGTRGGPGARQQGGMLLRRRQLRAGAHQEAAVDTRDARQREKDGRGPDQQKKKKAGK